MRVIISLDFKLIRVRACVEINARELISDCTNRTVDLDLVVFDFTDFMTLLLSIFYFFEGGWLIG